MELEFAEIGMKYGDLRIRVPGAEKRLMASLATEGQQNPVLLVSASRGDSPLILIDGYRRVEALKKLGKDTVEAMVLPLSEKEGLIFRQSFEETQKQTAFEDGWLMVELMEEFGMSQVELTGVFHRSESWVSRRLSLVRELPKSVQEMVRQGKLCSYAAMKYLVPLARAKKSECEELSRNLSGQQLSSREVERIYVGYVCAKKNGDIEQRRRILSKPLLYLKAREESESGPEKRDEEEQHALIEDFKILLTVSGRARLRMEEMRKAEGIGEKVTELFSNLQFSIGALAQAIKEKWDVGSRDTNSDFGIESQGAWHSSDSAGAQVIAGNG